MLKTGDKIGFLIPPPAKNIIRDYAGGIGFEKTKAKKDAYFLPPLDLIQLASCMRPDFQTFVIDAEAENITQTEIEKLLISHRPQAVIVKVSFPTFSSDISFIRSIKKIVTVVIPKIETSDKEILASLLKNALVDFCLISECESNIKAILKGTDKKGTAYLAGDDLVVDKGYLPVGDLDSLPFPNRGLLQQVSYCYPKLGICTTILTSRGCPYPCGYYCPYPLTQGKTWRSKSAERVIEEIKEILNSGINKILFRDAVFTLDVPRAHRICDLILKEKLAFTWWCETRADKLPTELIDKLSLAGCIGINIGVESGDPGLRYSLLKKGVSDELLLSVCQNAHKNNIKIAFLLMVGFPGEKRTSILKTAELLVNCKPDDIGINYPVNYPGTKLNIDAVKYGWVDSNSTINDMDGSKPVITTSDLSAGEMIYSKQVLEVLFDSIKTRREEEIIQRLQEITDWAKNKN